MDKLTGLDYATRPYLELQSHPDFSPIAYQTIAQIRKMSTKELEEVNLYPTNRGNRSN